MTRQQKLTAAAASFIVAVVLVIAGGIVWAVADSGPNIDRGFCRELAGVRGMNPPSDCEEPDHTPSFVLFGAAALVVLLGVVFLASAPPPEPDEDSHRKDEAREQRI